jgi:hypothetical protein
MSAPPKIVGVKNWDAERQCWIGAVCQVAREDDGSENVCLLDFECADSEIAIDDWITQSIATRPWEAAECSPNNPTS